jgi:tetratricopeptide (TPR) repeat protein
MPRVFISHARVDRAQARRLAEALRQAGHTPWIAEDEARIGEALAETLARGLRDTDTAVVVVSRASVESAWTSTEVSLLRSRAHKPLRWYVARLDQVPPAPDIPEEGTINLFPGETAWQSGVKRLLHSLGEEPSAVPSDEPSDLPPNNLPPRMAPFVGREQELVALHEHLMSAATGSRALLLGQRGMGKTALALEYATRYATDYPGGIWMVPAGLGPKRAMAWLSSILYFHHDVAPSELEEFPLEASYKDIAHDVSRLLQSNPGRVLLILDDLKGGNWRDYLHAENANILATSRAAHPPWLRPAFVQHVQPLPWREAAKLLPCEASQEQRITDDTPCRRIFKEWLRGNPLLIRLVSRLVARTQTPWERLEQELLRRIQGVLQGPSHEGAAWQSAVLDLCIEQFPPDSLHRQVLEGTSVFAHSLDLEQPLAWAAATGQSPSVDDIPEEAIQVFLDLEDSGLFQTSEPYCRAHGLITQHIRSLAAPHTWNRITEQGLTAILEWIQEQEHYDSYDPWSTEEAALHLEAALYATRPQAGSHTWVKAANVLASRFSRRREYLTAKALLERALMHAGKLFRDDVEFINSLRANLAATYDKLGNKVAALHLMEQAVLNEEPAPTVHNERKAQRLADLALLQFSSNQPAAALVSIERALQLGQEAPTGSDSQRPMRLFLRARILRDLGRTDEAHEVLEEALLLSEQYREEAPFALTHILEALAESRRERDDEKGALALLERAVEEDRRLLGDAHYETVFHLTELARTYSTFERRSQTVACVERVLPLLDKALTPMDPRRAEILLKLAESLSWTGEHSQAIQLLSQALVVESAQPLPDFNRLSALVITSLLRATEKDEAALDVLLERALTLTQHAAHGNQAIATTLAKLLTHVLGSRETAALQPPATPLMAPSPGAGAESLERAVRLAQRSKVRDELKADALREALDAAQKGNDPANGARALLLLADLEGRRGAWEQARANARQGLQFALRAEAPPLVADGYRLLGDAALHGSFYEEARMSYEEAIRRYDQLEETHRATQTRALLVSLLMQLGRQDGIEDHVRWLDAHQLHPALTEEDQKDVREVLALAGRRLSAPASDDRQPKS